MKFIQLIQYTIVIVFLYLDDSVVEGIGNSVQLNCSLELLPHIPKLTPAVVLPEDTSVERDILGIELAAFCLGITLTMMAISTKYSLAHDEIETLINQDSE